MKIVQYLLLGLVVLCFASSPLRAQNILLLNEQCGGSTAYFPDALAHLGFEFTETNETRTFFRELTSGTLWDLVIIDEYYDSLPPEMRAEIQAYIDGGGRIYMSYWDWDSSLALSFGAALIDAYYEPREIYPWESEHFLLSAAHAVPTLVPTKDTCYSDGARFEPFGGNAVAGTSTEPTPGEAGLIVGNEGRTVLFGGIPGVFDGDLDGDSVPDMLELAENVILFLLPANCVPDATTLCIDDQPGDRRFVVSVSYASEAGGGVGGDAVAVRLSRLGMAKGGLFCFYDPANPEILVKVLNGCHVNDRMWVFIAAATNLGSTLTIEDTFAGVTKTYGNPDLFAAQAVTDTLAFDTCSTPAPSRPEITWRPTRRVEDLLKALLQSAPARNNANIPTW